MCLERRLVALYTFSANTPRAQVSVIRENNREQAVVRGMVKYEVTSLPFPPCLQTLKTELSDNAELTDS